MVHNHNEIEVKFQADHVDVRDFKRYFNDDLEASVKHVIGPDTYWSKDEDVVRHRIDSERGSEITVKRRKSLSSTKDREEIDLPFGPNSKVTPDDIDAWLRALHFTELFSLTKEAWIVTTKLTPNVNGCFVIYEVWLSETPNQKRRFIEIEIEKGSNITVETAKRHLNTWAQKLQSQFKLQDPLNQSLYEIYSGRKNTII